MADWTNILAEGGAFGSFLAALIIYWRQKAQNQATEVARLHQMWWSEEMHEHRILAFKCVQESEKNDKR